jgi:hypothetical protein
MAARRATGAALLCMLRGVLSMLHLCLVRPRVLQANVRNYYMQFTEGPNADGPPERMDGHPGDMMHSRNMMHMGPRDMPPRMGPPGMGMGPGMGPPGMGPGGGMRPPFMGGPGMGPPRGERRASQQQQQQQQRCNWDSSSSSSRIPVCLPAACGSWMSALLPFVWTALASRLAYACAQLTTIVCTPCFFTHQNMHTMGNIITSTDLTAPLAAAALHAVRPARPHGGHGWAHGRPWHGRTGYGWAPRTIRTRCVLLTAKDAGVVHC